MTSDSGDGKVGTVGKISGNASMIAIELSNAVNPNTTSMLVIRKKSASLFPLAKWPAPWISCAL